jgi:hypothetical protein
LDNNSNNRMSLISWRSTMRIFPLKEREADLMMHFLVSS